MRETKKKTCSFCNKVYGRDVGYKHRDGKCKDASVPNKAPLVPDEDILPLLDAAIRQLETKLASVRQARAALA